MDPALLRRLDRSSRWLLPLCVLAALTTVRFVEHDWVEGIQQRAFDAYLNKAPRPYATDLPFPVRVVDIDEESLTRVGQFPWPRTKVAELVTRLNELGAAVVAFDVTFPEADRTSPGNIVKLWPDDPELASVKRTVARLPDHDLRLARAMKAARVVTGFAPLGESTPRLPRPKATFAFGGDGPRAYLDVYRGAAANLPVLDEAASGVGSFGFKGEFDGVIRRVPVLFNVGDQLFPSLPLEALRVAQGAANFAVKASGASGEKSFGAHTGISKVKVGRYVVPTDGNGRLFVYYTDSRASEARTVSAWRVLDRKDPPKGLKGALVFVGTSAAGLRDLRATPMDPAAPGVDVHANIAEQIQAGAYLERPDWADGAELVLTVVLGLLLTGLLARLGAVWSAPIGAALIAGTVWLSWHSFVAWHWLLDPVYPGVTLAGVYASFAGLGYVRSERDRRKITDTFGRYLSPKVVEQLAKAPGKVELGGETREMTFHFCDIRGFTTISEKFDPHGLTDFINRFLTPMTEIILAHDGTIDKYMGDCIMAFWNAPMTVPDHARKACAAALAMHARLAELNARWQAEAKAAGRDLPEIHIGTGLNTGPCVVGNMGSTLRVDYTVLGDDVNLASRLEGQSKSYGVNVVIGPGTREQAPEFATLELDLIKVKGKTKPVHIFVLLGGPEDARSEAFGALRAAHEAMLDAYRRRDWDAASARLAEARGLAAGRRLEKLYALYEERIAHFRANPPGADWDGVFTALTK